MKYFILIILALFHFSCSSSSISVFSTPTLITVDSTNDRIFVLSKDGILYILEASSREGIGDQPVVDDETEEDIHELLPPTPTNMVVANVDGTSRLFITGAQDDSDDNRVTNQILVLDYDDEELSQSSISPITLSDGDDTTDETGNVIGGLLADSDNNRLYVTDSTDGLLYIYNTTDGTEDAVSLDIGGIPNKMSLDGTKLYVANSTIDEALVTDQVITVVNTGDFSTTEIDLDIPVDSLSILSNDTGTVLLAHNAISQEVLIHQIDSATFATSTAISVDDDSADDGEINPDNVITSAISGVLLTKSSDGTLYGYVPQDDGEIILLTISSDLSSFTAEALSSSTEVLGNMDVLVDGSGIGDRVFIVSSGSGLVIHAEVGSTDIDTSL